MCRSVAASACVPVHGCRSMRASSPAAPRSIRRRSPARACRWTSGSATRSTLAASSPTGWWRRPSRPSPVTARWPASLPRSRTRNRNAHRHSASSISFAHYYTPAVVALAVLVAVLGPLLFGGTWGSWFYQALVMLVIACPCALVVSTPITVVSGLAAAARHGILIKGGEFLETSARISAVALDKTGTLTLGKPALTDARTVRRPAARRTPC